MREPKWWRFGQDGEAFDIEAWQWSQVMPGDVVQSMGTFAFKQRDFIGRTEETKGLRLKSAPVLVLSRVRGIPGEEEPGEHVTFVCLSRHGLILVVQSEKTE